MHMDTNNDQPSTSCEAVVYQIADVRTCTLLLSSPEKEVVLRALYVLTRYCAKDKSELRVLYDSGILQKIITFLRRSDISVLRFTLKLIAQLVTAVPEAAQLLSLEEYDDTIKRIAYLFITIGDQYIKEFSAQVLACCVKNSTQSLTLLRFGILVPLFNMLKISQDPDVQINVMKLFIKTIEAREAIRTLGLCPEFTPKPFLCLLRSRAPEVREVALHVIETLTTWRWGTVQERLRDDYIIETLFKLVMNPECKDLHLRAFTVIQACITCLATAVYFVKSIEFLQFCKWARSCPEEYLLPVATVAATLTKAVEIRQLGMCIGSWSANALLHLASRHIENVFGLLFDFSFEETFLSFFRSEEPLVFFKVCESISNMSNHRYCCMKMVENPAVIWNLLSMLLRSNIPIVPYHEIALKTVSELMKRNENTIQQIVNIKGLDALMDTLLRDKSSFTYHGVITILDILYIFSAKGNYKNLIMNSLLYEMLLDIFDDEFSYSEKTLPILYNYMDGEYYRQFFIEFKGPQRFVTKIQLPVNLRFLKDILSFISRVIQYKDISVAFLHAGCIKALEKQDLDDSIEPIAEQLITTLYDLYLPFKFHKLGRLEVSDRITSCFYIVKDSLPNQDFPFLEILERQQVVPRRIVYIAEFGKNANMLPSPAAQMSERSFRTVPETKIVSQSSLLPNSATSSKTLVPQYKKKSSILKTGAKYKSQRLSLNTARAEVMKGSNEHVIFKLHEDSNKLQKVKRQEDSHKYEGLEKHVESRRPLRVLTKNPDINYGFISEDPYLPKYVEKLKLLMYRSKKNIVCPRHHVKLLANAVNAILSGPEGGCADKEAFLNMHIMALKHTLGTSLIPLGFLRYGRHCERALLFKVLADKLSIPCTLVRGKSAKKHICRIYWNEIPVPVEESLINIDASKHFFRYAIVDLIHNIGNLIPLGSLEEQIYCGNHSQLLPTSYVALNKSHGLDE